MFIEKLPQQRCAAGIQSRLCSVIPRHHLMSGTMPGKTEPFAERYEYEPVDDALTNASFFPERACLKRCFRACLAYLKAR